METYKNLVIYYFSGTGNSKNVATWMSDVAIKNNVLPFLINIANTNNLSSDPPPAGALVAFVSPIHGFNYPPIMLNFIRRFPKGKNNVLLVNTRAGMLIGKFVTPGLTGIAFYLSALILKLKGYSITGMYPVDLPSNWISIHPGLNERTVKYLHARNKEKVVAFAQNVLTGKKEFKALREVIQDAAVFPIAILYYFIGRFMLAKTYYASSNCDNCDVCIKNCPVNAIIKINNKPFWTFNCESCMKCMGNCPKKAIETAHGFIVGVIVINSSVVMLLFYKYLSSFFIAIQNAILKFVIEQFIFFLLLGISYRVIHYCLRFKFIERIIVYTSLTKYKFWGRRYKAIKY